MKSALLIDQHALQISKLNKVQLRMYGTVLERCNMTRHDID